MYTYIIRDPQIAVEVVFCACISVTQALRGVGVWPLWGSPVRCVYRVANRSETSDWLDWNRIAQHIAFEMVGDKALNHLSIDHTTQSRPTP